MLALTRKKGESIIIGDNIRVKVVKFNISDGVLLAIDAPRHIEVDREEVRNNKRTHGRRPRHAEH